MVSQGNGQARESGWHKPKRKKYKRPVGSWRRASLTNCMSQATQRPGLRRSVFWVYLLAVGAGLAALAVLAHSTAYFPADLEWTLAMQRHSSPALDAFALAVDWLGYLPQVVILTALVGLGLFVAGRRWEGGMTGVALALEGALDGVVKILVRRPRPELPEIHTYSNLGDYSFPSGHVASYLMLFGFMVFLCLTLMRPSWLRTVLVVVLVGLVVLVGPVRVYLGDHWPSDVLAGYLVGAFGLPIVIRIYAAVNGRFSRRHQKA